MNNINPNEFDVTVIDTENPEDWLSSKAVDLLFSYEDRYIGHCSISGVDSSAPLFYNFQVQESERNQGFGSAIVDWCVENYNISELTVDAENWRAIHVYEKSGFYIDHQYYDSEFNVEMFCMRRPYKRRAKI